MSHRSYRKQVLLFLIAVVLPSLVLVALTLRMISQERELAERRRAEETSRLAGEIGQQLLVRLEKIKLQEVSALESQAKKLRGWGYVNPEVVLMASVEENRSRPVLLLSRPPDQEEPAQHGYRRQQWWPECDECPKRGAYELVRVDAKGLFEQGIDRNDP